MPVLGFTLGLGLLVALLAASKKARAAEGPASSPAAPPGASAHAAAAEHIQRIVDSGDPAKIAAAAALAERAGKAPLAAQLKRDAKSAAVAHPDTSFPSPWKNLERPKWNLYVNVMRGRNPKLITPAYHLGLFGFGMRRLVDLGLASRPRRGMYEGRKVWIADWTPPLTADKFLGDADFQYQAFVKATDQDIKRIKEELPELVGSTIDGKPVTYSGLLAVIKQAGFEGLKEWASDPKIRAQHPSTTAQFERANGIF
jgi:hypothetical protein